MRKSFVIALFCMSGCAFSHGAADSSVPTPDSGLPERDAVMADPDSGPAERDAGPSTADAGSPAEDAGSDARWVDPGLVPCATDADCIPLDSGCLRYRCTSTTIGGDLYCFIGEWDTDGDGHSLATDGFPAVCGNDDCNDIDPESYPGASERADGWDNDCDCGVDEGLTALEPLLTIAVDPATPVSSHFVMGEVAVEVFRIRLTSGAEQIDITDFVLPVEYDDRMVIWNVRFMDAERGTFLCGTLAEISPEAPLVGFRCWGTFRIPPRTTIVAKVVVDVTDPWLGSVSGARFRFGVDRRAIIQAYVGLDGVLLDQRQVHLAGAEACAVWGSRMTANRTRLTAALHASTPSGLQAPASEAVIARFVLSNAANIGSYAATVESIAPQVLSTIRATEERTIRVWRDAVGPAANLLGEYRVFAGMLLRTEAPWAVRTTFDIAAGLSREVFVTADTRDAMSGDVIGVRLPEAGSIRFSDGMATDITVDSLPIVGPTLTY